MRAKRTTAPRTTRAPKDEPEPEFHRSRLYAAGTVHGPAKGSWRPAPGTPIGWVEADGTITREA